MSINQIYRQRILDHYKHPHNQGQITDAQVSHCEENVTCGDEICIDINFDKNGAVSELSHYGQGCAISQASVSMLTDKVLEEKMSKDDIAKITAEEIVTMMGIELSPVRLKCALLGLEVLKKSCS